MRSSHRSHDRVEPKEPFSKLVRPVIGGLAVLVIVPLLGALWQMAATWGWQPVKATIIAIHGEPYKVGLSSKHSPPSIHTAYRTILAYGYSVDGRPYEGREESPGGNGVPGSEQIAYYNPARPAESSLRKPPAGALAAGLVLDIALIIYGFGWQATGRNPKKRKR